ncbi:hypothetical protein TNCV_4473941 [Trichonephila clavipes]|nr:hypothetical protein TNCV_4473941 [Trichonephila clavipes]
MDHCPLNKIQNYKPVLDDRNVTNDCLKSYSKLLLRQSWYSQHRGTKDRRTRSSKSGVFAMSAEPTTIHAMRSCTVAIGVSYTSDFRWPKKKKSKGLRFVEAKQQVRYIQSTARDM